MDSINKAEPMLCMIVWMMDCDFKAAMVMLNNAWRRTGQETYEEAEGIDEEDDEFDDLPLDCLDDDRYAIVEYYESPDGSGAEVYYADEGKKTVSDIRFWMRVDTDEREKFGEAFREAYPDLAAGKDAPSLIEASYREYLYQKALGRYRRRSRLTPETSLPARSSRARGGTAVVIMMIEAAARAQRSDPSVGIVAALQAVWIVNPSSLAIAAHSLRYCHLTGKARVII